jgi:monofunctional biosynthetic peptidoglycan transglycosylase
LTVAAGGGSGVAVLPASPIVILPRAAGGGAAGVAAPIALADEWGAPARFADPGRDASGVSLEQTLVETPAAVARPLAPTDGPAPAFTGPVEGGAGEVSSPDWAKDLPVAEARKDRPVAEAIRDGPVAEARKDLPVAEPIRDGPVAEAKTVEPVAKAEVAAAGALPAPAPGEPAPDEPFLHGAPFAAPAPFPAAPPLPAPSPWSALPPPPQRTQGYFGVALRAAGGLTLALAVGVLLLILLYRVLDPPTSMLMLGQRLSGTPVYQRWVPIERISTYLSQAVILSEDAHFCRHGGVDWGELAAAIENARDGVARGGSTITMQVVKNLFLWPSRSYVRKALEFPLAYGVELAWPKRRILEIYLNIAEWGPGIFGAEAAALYHFRKSAAQLTPREAALLAVSLPNPLQRRPGRPGPGLQRLANHLAMRMHPGVAVGCLRSRQ